MEKWGQKIRVAIWWFGCLVVLCIPGSTTLIALLILLWIVCTRVKKWLRDLWRWLVPSLDQFEVRR